MNTVMRDLIVGCIQDAIKNENGKFAVDEDNMKKLVEFGAGVDALATSNMVYDVAAGVRTGTKSGYAIFEVDDLVLEHGAADPFFTAIQGVNTIEFSKSKSGRLVVTATVKGVLVRA